ncbi:fasciclin domain-containing protein [Sphaerisporangium sp. TRM90804]|uniref:fasciclin domain-containing protein n=1 Tax=Sphaerisporangium sp. TRM90804 TaxID=3031113 RepID=UPI00244D3BE7|nr:fasciclin domain-containing protein [Sphaerisporangium sp. TRM90804]MDH2430703.1 fasciclin domain-containing protein [Sphaerisporangium sp. TRM90804]
MKSRLLTLPIAAATLSISAAYGAAAMTGGGTETAISPLAAGVRAQPTESPATTPTESVPATPTESPTTTPTESGSPGATESPNGTSTATPFGPGCGSLPQSGPGSVADLANQPLGTALSQIKETSNLAAAAQKAGLVETLNSAQDVTVFAPVNKAFDAVPKETVDRLLSDKQALSDLLKYHVVPKRIGPADLGNGDFTTLQGGKLTTKGSGEDFKVNDAKVLCGNIATKNGTVYLIDAVLKPRS